jgi:hypothetical protein
MRGVTTLGDERKILSLLSALPGTALDEVLSRLDLDKLFDDIDNHLFGPDMHEKLADLLFDRAEDLSPETLAGFVHAAQTGPTLSHHERSIRRVLLSMRGEKLAAFKALLNARGDYHDLEKLVFDDIDNAEIRQDILDHIAREAAAYPVTDLKILCDIDDTVQARLHDRRYPKRTIYPGVVAFIEALERGGTAIPGMPGDLTFITARPMDVFGLIENYTRDALDELGLPPHTVLSGSFLHLLTHDSMADKKMENFNRYRLLFPEAGVVFIGDSGQGDVAVGHRMLMTDASAVRGIFIHDVRESVESVRERWRQEGIYPFDTYVGAAAEAYARGMITAEGLQAVIEAARREFAGIAFESEGQREKVRELLERDIAAVTRA